jgi:hypothetical protein
MGVNFWTTISFYILHQYMAMILIELIWQNCCCCQMAEIPVEPASVFKVLIMAISIS